MKKWQVLLGVLFIFMGLFALINLVFQVDLWKYVLPLILIGLGLFIILRPELVNKDVPVMMKLFGDIRRFGDRVIQNEELWLLAGDIDLYFGSSSIPEGETIIKIFQGLGEINLSVPADVGVRIESESAISEIKSDFGNQETFLQKNIIEMTEYDLKKQKLVFHVSGIINEIKLTQIIKT